MSKIDPAELQILETADGSQTLYVPHLDERYHSHNGALTEARHVYIQAGLAPFLAEGAVVNVLEVGFGTGLNALLSREAAESSSATVFYHTLELNPLPLTVTQSLSWPELLPHLAFSYQELHKADWEKEVELSESFTLLKQQIALQECELQEKFYQVVYFDAFAPEKDPELWEADNFSMLYKALQPGGCLVTYCAKGSIKRLLRAVGFTVEALPGPPGKREMVRARK
jgi:tRNA U34 5-methylaminomethyl-2-thiouridine-forming methyltransferase MnmC